MELIITDAVIVTMAGETGDGEAGALLVRDGRIAAVGPAEAVRAAASPGARQIRLDGATVVPGLIDAHCHVADIGYLAAAADCGQPAAPDIPAIQARLREAAERTPEGSWVTGSGYLEYKLREGRHPTRADLDQAVPDRPAVLYHTSLHAAVLNTAALREAGFIDGQPDPPDGAFGRDAEGRLDGVVYERPMFALFEQNLRRDIGAMGAAARARLVRRAGQRLAELGLTAACDADMRRDSYTAFAEADEAGLLSQRIYGLVVHDQVDWLLASGQLKGRGRRSDRLAAEAVKIWADGGMSSRTAAIHGSYPVPPYGDGIMYFTPGELTEMVRDFDAKGFQVCIHAQGDRAIEAVLDAYAFASWRRAGITVAGSSDAPVITADPLVGIRDAILRRTGSGNLLGPAERLTAPDALALYTTQAAFAVRRETEIGSLEPGKHADLTVLDGNPLGTDPERITGIGVLATVLGGRPVNESTAIFSG
jgi:hypothetical protein